MLRYRRISTRARRFSLGLLSLVGLLATIGYGVSGQAGFAPWFVAALAAAITCITIIRYGNAPFLYVADAKSRLDPRFLGVVALLGGLSLLYALLPENWAVTFWAIVLGGLTGFTVAPPSRPASR